MNSFVISNFNFAKIGPKEKSVFRFLIFFRLAALAFSLCWLAPEAKSQSPSLVSGTTFAVAVADGTYPFDNSGYYFLIANNSGNNLQLVNIVSFTNSTGTYAYTSSGATAQFRVNNTVFGQLVEDLEFADSYFGNYTLTSTSYGGQQHGDFIWFNGQAPASIAGKIFACNINDGADPFSFNGSSLINFSATGNTYTITKDDSTDVDSYGSYTYSKANSATGKLVLNDSKAGVVTAFFAFADGWTGSFGMRNTLVDGFQIGDFQILDTTAPAIEITNPRNGRTLSNEVATAVGRAADNVSVLYVVYSINGSDWLAADSINNYENWSAEVVLTPGTNVFSTYAVDASGNQSAITTAKYVYVVSSPMSVAINGRGSITPAYNNALLQVGANYTMMAKPASGYNFTGWSDGINIISTQTAITFNMVPGLALFANFMDVGRPNVSILSPTVGQRLSNNVFNVTGKSTDNDRVTQVFYSINDGDWLPANTGNNWATWIASANLRAGNNRIKCFAIDASGNYSATNSVDCTYVLSAPIALHVNGGGKISPYANGARLAIGQRYTLSATASNGFGFINWKDAYGTVLTNKSTMSFVMRSNLDFTAAFADSMKPSISITKKPGDLLLSGTAVTVFGRATDNSRVNDVFFRLNDGGWQTATTANNWTDWAATLALVPGTNIFTCYCVDPSGNTSLAASTRIIYSTAPASLNNFSIDGLSDYAHEFNLSFTAKNFCHFSTDPGYPKGMGVYTYTKLSASTGRLRLNFTAPPIAAGIGYYDFTLYFTSANTARFTNQNAIDSGSWTITNTPSMTVTSLVKRTVYYVNTAGAGEATYFNSGKFWTTDLSTSATNSGTSLSYAKFSPIATLLKQTNSAGCFYTIAKYDGTNYGSAYVERYRPDGSYLGSESGNFGFASPSSDPNAPPTLAGRSISIFSGSSSFKLGFSTSTFSQQSADSSFDGGIGNYSYSMVTGNAANLALNYTAPANLSGNSSLAALQFYAPNLAYLENADSTVSAAVLHGSDNSYATSLAGKLIFVRDAFSGAIKQYQLNSDGSFYLSGGANGTGSYYDTSVSPQVSMLQIVFSSGDYAGNTGWLQLNYDASNHGSCQTSIFDSGNNLLEVQRGSFSQQ